MFDTALVTFAQHYPGYGPGSGPHLWFLLIPLFWLILAIVLVAIFGRRWSRRAAERREFFRSNWQAAAQSNAQGGAEQVLAERFARGDIDEVEYRARIEVLRATPPTGGFGGGGFGAGFGPGSGPHPGGGFGTGSGPHPSGGFGTTGPGMPPQV